jgi:hypothetical protein
MSSYSSFIQTIYDEPKPIGYLGRGTHYSVFRAVVFEKLDKAKFHDFAVIWDEDHDQRIISVIEELYFNGLLSHVAFIGERKAMVTLLIKEELSPSIKNEIEKKVKEACEKFGDFWSVEIGLISSDNSNIISDSSEKVSLYLNNIQMLWSLGTKDLL